MKKILFDMDWTLYSFENWKYAWSNLENEVENNALKLLEIFEWNDCFSRFQKIKNIYWEKLSIAFKENYSISKNDYFDKVWDIEPSWLIINNRNSLEVFKYLKTIWFDIYVVSESPFIWINRVLTFLKINDLVNWVYSWQWDERKSNWLLYEKIRADIWSWYLMVWDQIQSDIVMSKISWFKPVYISGIWEKSLDAEYNIDNLYDLYNIIK